MFQVIGFQGKNNKFNLNDFFNMNEHFLYKKTDKFESDSPTEGLVRCYRDILQTGQELSIVVLLGFS